MRKLAAALFAAALGSVVSPALILGSAGTAHADGPRPETAADAHFQRAPDAIKNGDFGTACREFAESQRLDPAPGTLLNLSECEERLGQIARAWRHLKEAIAALRPEDDRLPMAREWLQRLEARLPILVVRLAKDAPPGAVVTRDGVELGPASLGSPDAVEPGEHVVRVRAPGREESLTRVVAVAGETHTAEVAPGAAAQAEASPPSNAEEPSHFTPLARVGVIVGAAGVIAAGVGLGVGAAAKSSMDDSRKSHCGTVIGQADPNACDAAGLGLRADARHEADIATVLVVVGGVAVASGAALLVTQWLSAGSKAAAGKRRGVVAGVGPRTFVLRGEF